MAIHPSARNHGVANEDIRHATDHALAIEDAGDEADRAMSKDRVYGHTRSGKLITGEEIESLAAEAEAGYDVEGLLARRGKRGRPALGSAPASVESVRLDPELRDQLLERAKADGTTTSELIREALRRFLQAA